MSTFHINLHEVVYSLSDALDLVGVTHIHHGKRVAYMAIEIGKQLGWSDPHLDELFQAAILHDCGVSKTTVHSQLTQLEWEHEKEHCDSGSALLRKSTLLSNLATTVRHHHTHWDVLKDLDLPWETKLSANCIYLADRIDVLTVASMKDQANVLLGVANTRQIILDRRGDWFCPELVDAFMAVSLNQLFWLLLEGERVHGYAAGWIARDQYKDVNFSDLRDLVHLFSVIVDTKSVFTREHSDGVASLARYIGTLLELPERNCEMLELAGLLHDIGKLRVPDALLEKPGKLTPEEYSIVQQHSFDTFNILKTISGLSEITLWAAQHHERADGSDDYYHAGISLEAKIVAVADVFQALAQHRPYRQSMQPEQIVDILRELADGGKLDQNVVSHVVKNFQACWDAALPG